MINRHIMIAGSGRTGTSGMTQLFRQLIGRENVGCGENILGNRLIRTYNLDNPPQRFVDFVLEKQRVIQPDRPYFNGNWQWAFVMYLVEQYIPSVRFFVTLRDPIDTVTSMKQWRWNRKVNKGSKLRYNSFSARRSDEDYLDEWIRLYGHILRQIERMKHKPFIINFDYYVKSVYNQLFLDLYGLDKNPRKIREFLKVKINSQEQKVPLNINERKIVIAYDVFGRVVMACLDNWVVKGIKDNRN